MRKRVKFKWDIFIGDDGRLVINLNEGLNSSIPLTSSALDDFKAEKRAEIEFFKTINPSTITGFELLA